MRLDQPVRVHNEFTSILDGSKYALEAREDSDKSLYDSIGRELPLEELVRRMIVRSSNLATNIVIELIGAQRVMALMQGIGANDIQVLRGVEDDKAYHAGMNNTATAYDLMLIFRALGESRVISADDSKKMIEILAAQEYNDGIPAGLPQGTRVAHKTGTITLGNRQATEFRPLKGISEQELADAAQLASLADETPEGRSIVVLAKQKYAIRGRDVAELNARFIPFTAQSRMSGVEVGGSWVRKGAVDAVRKHVEALGGHMAPEVLRAADEVSRRGSTPLAVAEGNRVLGIVELKDIVKTGIQSRFAELRAMGIKTVMITGDNKLTAAAIAAEAGVDDFLAEATPEDKLALIRQYQAEGRLVAMTGDGTNDAPALAQADVAVAMGSGTQAAKEAGNMVDLDSNPTKLLEVVETGKALLMTRGSLTTFSIANDVAKYFAIIPAIFVSTYPQLGALNVMRLGSPSSAILSAVIFNALVIVFLIPLALKGVRYRPVGAAALLRRNLAIYGLGGLVVPFIGIKLIDWLLVAVHLV